MFLSHLPVRRRAFLSSGPLQLTLALIACAVVPFLFYASFLPDGLADSQAQNTAFACALAIIIGFWLKRSMIALPGARQSSTILPAYVISYGLVLLGIVVFRAAYSRALLTTGFAITIAWFYAMNLFIRRRSVLKLGVVPGGRAAAFRSIPRVVEVPISLDSDVRDLDAVTADFRFDHGPDWERRLCDMVLEGVPVYHARDLVESLTGRTDLKHLTENDLGQLAPMNAFLMLKLAVDRVTAVPALLLLAPFLMAIGVLIRLDSPGPAFFRQERVGHKGRRFTVYKFRTMIDGGKVGDEREAAITKANDQRITRLGQFLRRSRIDELPQIFNIVRGEMSWIGPRPEAVALSLWYETDIPFYRYRHAVMPGITGWAQVNQGHVADLADVTTKAQYDFYYIRNFSLWLDLLVLVRTVRTVFTGFGSK